MAMIRRPLTEITREDIEGLCRESVIEDEQIDFKQTIPHKEGEGRDPWRDNRDIKQYGRDQLLATLVAFANSYGGDLVIGIRDDGSQPGKAEELTPIPECQDAAHRLGQSAAACIEPPVAGLQTHCVLTEGAAGAIVIRVPRSRMAPHRLTSDRHCYQRVRHETMPMTMRQIQDLTFNVVRGLEAVDRRFSEARRRFYGWTDGRRTSQVKQFRIRVTAVPTAGEVYLERVHAVDAILPMSRSARMVMSTKEKARYDLAFPFGVNNWRPALRSTVGESSYSDRAGRITLSCDGMINYEYCSEIAVADDNPNARGYQRTYVLCPEWYLALVANTIETAQRFRVAAGASVVEYGLEAEIVTTHDLPVLPIGPSAYTSSGTIPAGSVEFPRYAFGPPDTWRESYLLLYRDFWDSVGVDARGDDFIIEAK